MNKINSNPETKVLTTSGAVAYSSLNLRQIVETGNDIKGEEIEVSSPKTTASYALSEEEMKILTSKFKAVGFSDVKFTQYGRILGMLISDNHTFKFLAEQNGDRPYISVEDAKKLLFRDLKYQDEREPATCCVLDGLGGSIYHLKPTEETIKRLKEFANGKRF